MKMEHAMSWTDFKPFFKNKFESFVLHKAANTTQKHARDKIYNKHQGNILLTNSDLFASIDYIENIKAKFRKNPINMFRNPAQIAFCEIYQTTVHDNELIRASHCFFSDDPCHDWQMSLYIIKKYINYHKKIYTNNNNTLKRCFFFSDRSPKEFSCTSFLQGINEISCELGVEIWWDFTSPNHGKWVHDGVGGNTKDCGLNGMAMNKIDFKAGTSYATTFASYLSNKMITNKQKQNKQTNLYIYNNINEQKYPENNDNNNNINNINLNNDIVMDNNNNNNNNIDHGHDNNIININENNNDNIDIDIDIDLNNNANNIEINNENKDNNQYKHDRIFHVIGKNEINRVQSDWATLKNITKYYCFRTCNDMDNICYRRFSCFCDDCLNSNYDNCVNNEIYGPWEKYEFNKKHYCICNKSAKYKAKQGMVACDTCNEWYHCYCMNVKRHELENVEWKCPSCVENNDML